jgi:phosphohistidine swiveling domain-containing protein
MPEDQQPAESRPQLTEGTEVDVRTGFDRSWASGFVVAEVTDVGYTAAFCYAAAVVTELGGPMSHAAVVAREFGFPCVVDAQGATRSLPAGALVEVDGTSGEIRLLELATDGDLPLPADGPAR